MTGRKIRLCGRELERPGHICALFDSRDAEYLTLIPYLRDGIDDGEEILTVVDADRLEEHRSRLRDGGVEGEHLKLATSEESYLPEGRFDIESMAGFVTTALADAARRGKRVRTAGWMDWVHKDFPGTERAFEYEARMNHLCAEYDATFVCVYDLSQLNGGAVADILATHPWVILNGEVRENPFYVQPERYLAQLITRRKTA